MKEITRTIKAEITIIEQMPDEDAEVVRSYKQDAAENVKSTLKKLYMSPNVQVEIHDTVRDVNEKTTV